MNTMNTYEPTIQLKYYKITDISLPRYASPEVTTILDCMFMNLILIS